MNDHTQHKSFANRYFHQYVKQQDEKLCSIVKMGRFKADFFLTAPFYKPISKPLNIKSYDKGAIPEDV